MLRRGFESPGEFQKPGWGIKEGGKSCLAPPPPRGSVGPSLRDSGHAGPLSLLLQRSGQAKRVKVDSFINSNRDYPARRAQQHQQPVMEGYLRWERQELL